MLPPDTYRNNAADPVRVHQRPLERLHTAQRRTGHQFEFFDSKFVKQKPFKLDHVADRDAREVNAIGFVRARLLAHRTGTAVAATQNVCTNDKVTCRIKSLAGADNTGPPCINIGRTRKSMTNQNGMVLRIRNIAPGSISNLDVAQYVPILKREFAGHLKNAGFVRYLSL